jgi:hypothetical protein
MIFQKKNKPQQNSNMNSVTEILGFIQWDMEDWADFPDGETAKKEAKEDIRGALLAYSENGDFDKFYLFISKKIDYWCGNTDFLAYEFECLNDEETKTKMDGYVERMDI